MEPLARTPRETYVALALYALTIVAPLALWSASSLTRKPGTDDGLGDVLMGLGVGFLVAILAVGFTVAGAWNGPRSKLTRLALSLAGLWLAGLVYVYFFGLP